MKKIFIMFLVFFTSSVMASNDPQPELAYLRIFENNLKLEIIVQKNNSALFQALELSGMINEEMSEEQKNQLEKNIDNVFSVKAGMTHLNGGLLSLQEVKPKYVQLEVEYPLEKKLSGLEVEYRLKSSFNHQEQLLLQVFDQREKEEKSLSCLLHGVRKKAIWENGFLNNSILATEEKLGVKVFLLYLLAFGVLIFVNFKELRL